METKKALNQNIFKKAMSFIVTLAMILSLLTGFALNSVSDVNAADSTDGYVIENTTSNALYVTVKHLLYGTSTSIYTSDVKTLDAYGKINNYKKADNYDIASVKLNDVTVAESDWKDIKVSKKSTVKVYYKATTDDQSDKAVSFYDYIVRPTSDTSDTNSADLNKSINAAKNYSDKNVNNNFTVGHFDQDNNGLQTYAAQKSTAKDSNGNYINSWSSNLSTTPRVGIIKGLDSSNSVLFNYDEPGVFTDASVQKAGKTNIDNYKLRFSRNGDTYQLRNVLNENGQTQLSSSFGTSVSSSDNFFPLNHAASNTTDYAWSTNGTNYYFGMRYDVEFTLGDYNGDLKYNFSGDDDMWVLLDGKVVLDLGGIHSAVSGEVNIWNKLGITKGNQTDTQKTAKHRLTVLYMERGGNASNCYMNFTIPNATFVDVTNAPKTNLTVNKTDTDGHALENAQFTLTDSNANTSTLYSDANGHVNLTNLVKGVYTLKEVAAPDGYELNSDNTYKVIVTENSDGTVATAKLYKSNGTTLVDDNTITNESSKEKILNSIEESKTAKLTNWYDRTYQIKLTADSKYQTTSTTTINGTADVMLCLDKSGSMGYTNLGYYATLKSTMDSSKTYYINDGDSYVAITPKTDTYYSKNYGYYYDTNWYYNGQEVGNYWSIFESKDSLTNLKTAASGFVDLMNKDSATSKIGMSAFNTAISNEKLLSTISDSTASALKSEISSLKAIGGTSPEVSLSYAYDQLTSDSAKNDGNKKVVILFTDGAPTGSTGVPAGKNDDTSYWSSKEETEKQITALKTAGVTVYTVGLGLGTNAASWLKTLASKDEYALTTSDSSQLESLFSTIEKSLVSNRTINATKIYDTIDSRFTITAEEKTRLESLGAVITESNGEITVTWNNQVLPYYENGKWMQTINIVAKDSYIGGNNIATNDGGGIVTEYGDVKFEKPTVNVKVDLDIADDKETLFSGETYNGNDSTNKMFTTSGTFTKTWYTSTDFTEANKLASDADLLTKIAEDKKLYLRVGYNAGDDTSSSNANSTIDGQVYKNDSTVYATNKDNDDHDYGILTVNFLKGKLDITKTIDKQYTESTYLGSHGLTSTNTVIHSDQTFIFKITRTVDGETKETFYQTISFDSSENETTKTVTIHNLKKGTYKVTEETMWSAMYSLVNVSDSTNGETTDFQLGGSNLQIGTKSTDTSYTGLDDDTGESKYTGYSSSKKVFASFTNQKKTWAGWNSDSASSTNTYGSN